MRSYCHSYQLLIPVLPGVRRVGFFSVVIFSFRIVWPESSTKAELGSAVCNILTDANLANDAKLWQGFFIGFSKQCRKLTLSGKYFSVYLRRFSLDRFQLYMGVPVSMAVKLLVISSDVST